MKRLYVLFAILITLALAACGGDTPPDYDGDVPVITPMPTPPIDDPPHRIISDLTIASLDPVITEVLITLGLAQNLVAVDDASGFIGGMPIGIPHFDISDPNIAFLVHIAPDIVLLSDAVPNHEGIMDALGADDIWSGFLEIPTTIFGIAEFIRMIGFYAEMDNAAQQLIDEMMAEITEIELALMGVSEARTVFFEIAGPDGPNSFGNGTFMNYLLDTVRAVNVFDERQGRLVVNPDEVVAANPNVILSAVPGFTPVTIVDEISTREGWGSINAVQNGRIHIIITDFRANHNIVHTLRQIAMAIYPENFE